MNMKIKLSLYTLVLLMAALTQGRVFAIDELGEPILPLEERFKLFGTVERAASESAQKMIGHLTLAQQSLEFKLKTSALNHLQTAKAEASFLLKEKINQSQELSLPFGRVTFEMGSGDTQIYIPVLIGEGFEGELDDLTMGKLEKVKIKNMSIVHRVVKLEMISAMKLMNSAQEQVENDQFNEASLTLDKLYAGMLVSEEKVKDPLLSVWANLVLAREFMNKSSYKSARYTLRRAQDELKRLEKEKVLKKSNLAAKELMSEIALLTKNLDEKAPGPWLKVKSKTKEWIGKVRTWI